MKKPTNFLTVFDLSPSVIMLLFTIVVSGLCWLGMVTSTAVDAFGHANYYLSIKIHGISVLGILHASFASIAILGLLGLLWDKRFFAIVTIVMAVANCVNLTLFGRMAQFQQKENIANLRKSLASTNNVAMPRYSRGFYGEQYKQVVSLGVLTEDKSPVYAEELSQEVMQGALDKFDRIGNSDSGHLVEVLLSEDFVFAHHKQGEQGSEVHTFNKKEVIDMMSQPAGDFEIVASQHTIVDIDISPDGKTATAHTIGTNASKQYFEGVCAYDFILNSEIFTFEIEGDRVYISKLEMEFIDHVQDYISYD